MGRLGRRGSPGRGMIVVVVGSVLGRGIGEGAQLSEHGLWGGKRDFGLTGYTVGHE
jgi:hypothetical protein